MRIFVFSCIFLCARVYCVNSTEDVEKSRDNYHPNSTSSNNEIISPGTNFTSVKNGRYSSRNWVRNLAKDFASLFNNKVESNQSRQLTGKYFT